MDECSIEIRGFKDHTKEQVLDAVRLYQEMTIDLHETTNKFKDRLDFNLKHRIEQQRRADMVFEKTSIEEEDLENSIDKLGLAEDSDYKALIDEGKVKQQEFLARLEKERQERQRDEAAAALAASKAKQAPKEKATEVEEEKTKGEEEE